MAKLNIYKDKLLKYMEENNLSQQDLAELIGVDYTMVFRVLKDERNPGPKFVAGILKNTELEFKDIFFTSNLPDSNKTNQKSA